jgi:acyl-coenzyme A thioesterase PaaI-like protein
MKELTYQLHAADVPLNMHGSVTGAWLFDVLDRAALVWINENITNKIKGVSVATHTADVKYHHRVLQYGFVSAYAECISVTPGKITIDVDLYNRTQDEAEGELAVSGTLAFSMIDNATYRLKRIPREFLSIK